MVIVCGIAAVIIAVVLVGRFYPGSGLEQLGMKTAREITETRERLEAEDLEQMLAGLNARRRARGEREVTESDMELRVAADMREVARRREENMAERELDQLLDATNARRRARGLPERTREQVQREFGRPAKG